MEVKRGLHIVILREWWSVWLLPRQCCLIATTIHFVRDARLKLSLSLQDKLIYQCQVGIGKTNKNHNMWKATML